MENERQVRSVSLGNGTGSVRFEVEDIALSGEASGPTEVARDYFSMDDIFSTVQAVAGAVSDGLSGIKAKRTVLEFGVEIGMEAGHLTAFVVKGSGKASLKITVEW
jgi:hypothetical protein